MFFHDEDLGKGGGKEGKKYVRQGQGGKVVHRRRARQDNENKNLGERSTIERQDLDNRAAAVGFTIHPTPHTFIIRPRPDLCLLGTPLSTTII